MKALTADIDDRDWGALVELFDDVPRHAPAGVDDGDAVLAQSWVQRALRRSDSGSHYGTYWQRERILRPMVRQ